ncbi:hypothetical protein C8F04DRAFT_1324309 [Mycena alexandri]|uniref:Uncharacterized protein n=1 Tax=Mycena alexandri TaxID=1745969 RepID=A0AAD6S0Q8_9AGAR|nr:hypothetical protein C8F04DRAFT_1324309 [Mycena alexandri]
MVVHDGRRGAAVLHVRTKDKCARWRTNDKVIAQQEGGGLDKGALHRGWKHGMDSGRDDVHMVTELCSLCKSSLRNPSGDPRPRALRLEVGTTEVFDAKTEIPAAGLSTFCIAKASTTREFVAQTAGKSSLKGPKAEIQMQGSLRSGFVIPIVSRVQRGPRKERDLAGKSKTRKENLESGDLRREERYRVEDLKVLHIDSRGLVHLKVREDPKVEATKIHKCGFRATNWYSVGNTEYLNEILNASEAWRPLEARLLQEEPGRADGDSSGGGQSLAELEAYWAGQPERWRCAQCMGASAKGVNGADRGRTSRELKPRAASETPPQRQWTEIPVHDLDVYVGGVVRLPRVVERCGRQERAQARTLSIERRRRFPHWSLDVTRARQVESVPSGVGVHAGKGSEGEGDRAQSGCRDKRGLPPARIPAGNAARQNMILAQHGSSERRRRTESKHIGRSRRSRRVQSSAFWAKGYAGAQIRSKAAEERTGEAHARRWS